MAASVHSPLGLQEMALGSGQGLADLEGHQMDHLG